MEQSIRYIHESLLRESQRQDQIKSASMDLSRLHSASSLLMARKQTASFDLKSPSRDSSEVTKNKNGFEPLLKDLPLSARSAKSLSPYREAQQTLSFTEFWITPTLTHSSHDLFSDQSALEDAVAQDEDGMSELIKL